MATKPSPNIPIHSETPSIPSPLEPSLDNYWRAAVGEYEAQLRATTGHPDVQTPGFPSKHDWDIAPVLFALSHERSDVASVARFAHRIETASYCIYLAFDRAHIVDFKLSPSSNVIRTGSGVGEWYSTLVNATFHRYRNLRKALLHHWTPPAEAETLTLTAFRLLSEITPADSQLRNLFVHDRSRACHELVRHLDIVAEQLKAAAELATDPEAETSANPPSEEEARLKAVQDKILRKAGELLSLTRAANQLGVSRQALHKRIRLGSALGLMQGVELVVPSAQFVTKDGKTKIVDGLNKIVALFDSSGAGRWSALQFLVGVDPLLSKPPLEALKQGEPDSAVRAAGAYLGLGEE